MRKLRQEIELEDGWSRWIPPTMANYLMACCSCGLVHRLQFRVVREIETKRGGWFRYKDAKGKYRVLFRAQRDEKATKLHRKRKKARK